MSDYTLSKPGKGGREAGDPGQCVQVFTKHYEWLTIQAGTPRPKPKFVLMVNRGKTPEFK